MLSSYNAKLVCIKYFTNVIVIRFSEFVKPVLLWSAKYQRVADRLSTRPIHVVVNVVVAESR